MSDWNEDKDAVKKARARARRKRSRRMPLRLPAILLLLILLVVGFGWLQTRPVSSEHRAIRVPIPRGAGVTGIGAILKEKGIVRSALVFDLYTRVKGKGKLLAGLYLLSPDMTLGQITRTLEAGPDRTSDGRIHVTLPEGYTLKQVAKTLGEKRVTDSEAFLKLATDQNALPELHADFPLPKETLEGYLFPDTYAFPPNTPPRQVLEKMLANFGDRFARPYQQEIQSSGKNLQILVTEASLIEREARVPEDRTRIAGVLDNRLKRGMRLQVDATVEYALASYKARLTYKDLRVDSPYNTYLHDGLPPGPIANPGLASLRAALHPETNPYLYYVARPNGTHIFSRTPQEHQAAIRLIQQERRAGTNATDREGTPGG